MSSAGPSPSSKPPMMVFVEGTERRQFRLQHVPFNIGRRVDKDLVLTESRCSRDHATITLEADGYYLLDQGSKLGTFVNGERVQRHRLAPNDRVEFGVRGGSYLLFEPAEPVRAASESGLFLSRVSGWVPQSGGEHFATLNLMLEAARKLNSSTVLDEVLMTLLEMSLRLTRAERGYVFLRDSEGHYKMAAGRNARGEPLAEDETISHSSLEEAAASGCEFVVTEAEESDKLLGRRSVEDFGIASVICIPLWNRSVLEGTETRDKAPGQPAAVRGVLYLDSRSLAGRLTAVSHDILRTLANEAATLVENAALVQTREAARRYEQELAIAATIQQRLMSVRIPEVPYGQVEACNLPCQQIGGDFYDVVRTRDALAVVVTDVCGKGVSAALLASVLQGLIYSQLKRSAPLEEVAAVAHGFLCDKEIGEKYATMLLARLQPGGEVELVNCGHVPPLIVSQGKVTEVEPTNPPVGLLPDVTFGATRLQLRPGDRLVVVTDGVTEAENAAGDYFGPQRLQALAAAGMESVLEGVREFCAGMPLQDDCTVLEMVYTSS